MTALTQDRIKAATIFANKEINSDLEMITHGRIYGQDVTEMEGDLECMRTCLAALDAVRWRDVSDKPENDQCVFLNCGYDCCWGFYDKRSDFVINPHNGDVNRLDAADRWYPIPLPFPKR